MAFGEKLPFDIGQNRTIFFDYKDLASTEKLKETLRSQIHSIEENPKEVLNPVSSFLALQEIKRSDNPAGEVTASVFERLEKYSENFQNIQDGINELLRGVALKHDGNAEARYISGESNAFQVLTEVTRKAKTIVRSTRFFPDSVLTQPTYVTAMEQRVRGTDGNPPLKHYYRIIALNNTEKQRDINHHLNTFFEHPFDLYLTSNENTFELVIIDDTDAFIHFYKQEKIIDSTLYIKGSTVVGQFIEIFNRLSERDLIHHFDCKKINQRNLIRYLDKVDEIFRERFTDNDKNSK